MAHLDAIDRYLDELRSELKVQFRRADIDRVVEEVQSHLLTVVDDEGAANEAQVGDIVAAFGSPAEVGRAYRKSGIRTIDPATASAQPKGLTDCYRPRPKVTPIT